MQRRDVLRLLSLSALLPGTAMAALERASRGSAPVKITNVEAFVLRHPKDDTSPEELIEMPPMGAMTERMGLWNRLDHFTPSRFRGYTQAVLVKISTDQGIVGWGECHAPVAPRVHKMIISDLLAPVLMGKDARDVEALWEKMYSTQRLRGYSTGFFMESIAGVDIALWDILGKFSGLPVYRLLGGKFRDRIPTYTWTGGASDEAAKENALEAVAQGYTAVKTGLAIGQGSYDLGRIITLSEALQGKAQLLVDSLGAFKLHEAIPIGRELDSLGNIGWWEDVLMPEDLSGFSALAQALDTAICAGQEISNRFQFRDMFAAKAVDIINPDMGLAGGITECRRIATLADAHGILWSPHLSTATPLLILASAHLAVATANCIIMEKGIPDGPWGSALLKEPVVSPPGYLVIPERPGLGVEFDEKELAKIVIG